MVKKILNNFSLCSGELKFVWVWVCKKVCLGIE